MKAGDLVRRYGTRYRSGIDGMIVKVCYDLGITTVDVLLNDGEIIYDQRIDQFKVIVSTLR